MWLRLLESVLTLVYQVDVLRRITVFTCSMNLAWPSLHFSLTRVSEIGRDICDIIGRDICDRRVIVACQARVMTPCPQHSPVTALLSLMYLSYI